LAHAYTPGLKVSSQTIFRKERRLPLKGDVLVAVGDIIKAEDVVARTELPGNVQTMNVANKLSVLPEDIERHMTVKVGGWADKGKIIAETRTFFGLFKSQCKMPVGGTIESVSAITGQVIIREKAIPVIPGEETAAKRRIRRVEVRGVGEEMAAELAERLPVEAGSEFQRSSIFSGIETLRRQFIRQGRIQSVVDAEVVEAEDGEDEVVVIYRVLPGPVSTVVLEGVTKKQDRRLRRQLETLWAESLFEENLLSDSAALIRAYFQQRGNYAVDVDSRVTEGKEFNEIRFVVDTGPTVRVREIAIQGAERISEERIGRQMLTRKSTLFGSGRLDPDVLDEDLAAIRNLYRDQGHLAVQIDEPRIRLSPCTWSSTPTFPWPRMASRLRRSMKPPSAAGWRPSTGWSSSFPWRTSTHSRRKTRSSGSNGHFQCSAR